MSISETSTPRPPPEPSLHESDSCPVEIGPVSEILMQAVDIALSRLNVPESDREKVKEGVKQRVKSRFTKVESSTCECASWPGDYDTIFTDSRGFH
jgi:hypothetical protein